MNIDNIKPENVEVIYIDKNNWNCDKCIFYISHLCESNSIKRLLFNQILLIDCDDCKHPFVLKS